jgi:hypothetical protein
MNREQRSTEECLVVHVFISYAREDFDFANKLHDELDQIGFDVWMDTKRVNGGDVWRSEIDEALFESYVVLLVLSPEANDSPYVTYEWSFALGIGTPVVPILAKPLPHKHPRLSDLHHVDFSNAQARPWNSIDDLISERIEDIPTSKLMDFLSFRRKIMARKRIISYTGIRTFYQYLGGLLPTGRGFTLYDLEWTLLSNSIFWRKLGKHQEEVADKEKICAFVTHAAAPDIWLKEDAKESLGQQREFVHHGGRIIRVFIGKDTCPLGDESKYKEAMAIMEESKINTFYMQEMKGDTQLDDYTWIPSLGILQTWRSKTEFGNTIVQVDLSEEDINSRTLQIKYWSLIKHRAVGINGLKLEDFLKNIDYDTPER